MNGRKLGRKPRKERINKCLAILSRIYPEDHLLSLSPREIEVLTFDIIVNAPQELIKKYWDKWDDTKGNKEND